VFRRFTRRCTHTDQIRDVKPGADGCVECLQMGDTWAHLRECLTCGHVGCCDSSMSLRGRNGLFFHTVLSSTGETSWSLVKA
jgi:hypothetical protein